MEATNTIPQDDDIGSTLTGLVQTLQFDYKDRLGNDLRCALCQAVLAEPVIQAICGERLHSKCYKQIMLLDKPTCPVCNQILDKQMCWRDVFADKQLASMQVFCPGQKNGCQFTGPKRLAQEHALTCEYIALECTNGCKKMIMISEFPNHLEIECDHRLVECELCEMQVKKIEIEVCSFSQVSALMLKHSWPLLCVCFFCLGTSGNRLPKTNDSV
jgi:hypothetical protein